MSVPSAYLGVIIIWSTTPLAIKWSGEGVGFLFGASLRMLIGLVCVMALLGLLRRRLMWNRDNWPSFVVAGLQIYIAMTATYWAAQHLPSGWISVLFGLTPIVTSLLASWWLKAHTISSSEIVGGLLGFLGLALIFADSFSLDPLAGWAVVAMLLAVSTHSAGAVWIKRLASGVDGSAMTAGGLMIATPLFLVHWWLVDGQLPSAVNGYNLGSIMYLGVFGSAIGFSLYFYLLKNVSVRALALITLLTPLLALWLGRTFNHEPVSSYTLAGTIVILAGLSLSQWGKQS